MKERRLHAAVPILMGAVALAVAPFTLGNLPLTLGCFMIAIAGMKAYQPAFWALPSIFLADAAAAGSIGLINSVGNLGGFLGPTVLGRVEKITHSFNGGIWFISVFMLMSAIILLLLGLGNRHISTPEQAAETITT
jgi:ACS family tartrate transporter-like MFS transporter